MSDANNPAGHDLLSRLKAAVAGSDGEVDLDSIRASVKEAAANAGKEIDVDAIMAQVKDVAGKAEDKIDSEKLSAWLSEAKSVTAAGMASAGAHGEKLAEQAPGVFDKLLGTAKEKLGELTGNEELSHQGELDQLKGEIKEKYAAQGE